MTVIMWVVMLIKSVRCFFNGHMFFIKTQNNPRIKMYECCQCFRLVAFVDEVGG